MPPSIFHFCPHSAVLSPAQNKFEMGDKRVGFAPAHSSVQYPPQWHEPSLVGNLVDPNPDAQQLHAALEDARLEVQRLEAQLQQKSLQRIPGPAVHSAVEGPLYADLHGQHVVPSPQAPPASHGSGTGRTSTFILPEMFGSAEFNSSTQPVPQPPAGYTYVWQYAGERRALASIRSSAKRLKRNPKRTGLMPLTLLHRLPE